MDYYTIQDIADELGVTKQAVQRYIGIGRLNAIRVFRRMWVIPPDEARRFIAERRAYHHKYPKPGDAA